MSSASHDAATFVVALTGGIASGKSAVARRFEILEIPLIDADAIAHALVQPGLPALAEIEQRFGRSVIAADGSLDRKRMREIVFADVGARQALEHILHPRIRAEIVSQVALHAGAYCVLAIPLLAEVQEQYAWVDRILVTDVPRTTQIERLTQRLQIDATMAERILDAQVPREVRLQLADDVIDNTGPIERLTTIVARLDTRFRKLATRAH